MTFNQGVLMLLAERQGAANGISLQTQYVFPPAGLVLVGWISHAKNNVNQLILILTLVTYLNNKI
jgi:hypothetical protein